MPNESPDEQPHGEIEVHRADQAYALHKQGKSLSDIAVLQGYDSANAVSQALSRRYESQARTITSLDRQSILAMELERLDDLQAVHWESAMYGDIKSGDFILKVMAHRMKLLKLDQPDADTSQQTVLIVGQVENEYVSQLKKLVERNG